MQGDKILFLLTFWSIWFFNYSSRTIFSPILPIIETELKISHPGAGGILSFVSMGYAVGLLLAGPLMQWWESRRLLLLGHGGLILFIGLFSFGKSYWFLASVCLLLGLVAGVYLPCAIPLLTERFSYKHWAKVIGFHGTAAPISLLIVPLMIALLLKSASWRFIILFFSFMGILLLPALNKFTKVSPALARPVKPDYYSLLKGKRIWVLGILQGIAASANLGIYAIIPLFLVSERGFTIVKANQLLGISRMGGVVVPFVVGAMADKFGYARTLMAVTFLAGVFTILMGISDHDIFLAVFLLLQTSIIIGFFPLSFAITSKTAE